MFQPVPGGGLAFLELEQSVLSTFPVFNFCPRTQITVFPRQSDLAGPAMAAIMTFMKEESNGWL
jgi:hypothetical protein